MYTLRGGGGKWVVLRVEAIALLSCYTAALQSVTIVMMETLMLLLLL